MVGIYPETKHQTYFKSIGLPLEENRLITLQKTDLPISIRSFEVRNLEELAKKTDLPLVQLIYDSGKPYDFITSDNYRTYQDLIKPAGLKQISQYAQAIGVKKNLLIPRDKNGKLKLPTSLIRDAHQASLLVHAWRFRNENLLLPLNFKNNPQDEYKTFFDLGIDGVFSEFTDTAVTKRNYYSQF
mgnify:FL=1